MKVPQLLPCRPRLAKPGPGGVPPSFTLPLAGLRARQSRPRVGCRLGPVLLVLELPE